MRRQPGYKQRREELRLTCNTGGGRMPEVRWQRPKDQEDHYTARECP